MNADQKCFDERPRLEFKTEEPHLLQCGNSSYKGLYKGVYPQLLMSQIDHARLNRWVLRQLQNLRHRNRNLPMQPNCDRLNVFDATLLCGLIYGTNDFCNAEYFRMCGRNKEAVLPPEPLE